MRVTVTMRDPLPPLDYPPSSETRMWRLKRRLSGWRRSWPLKLLMTTATTKMTAMI
jgi:hypothetical protein